MQATKSAYCYCDSLADGRCDFCTGQRVPPPTTWITRLLPKIKRINGSETRTYESGRH